MTQRGDANGTRERILQEASRLLAIRGYAGSSTREIAERVGIRQPSLFHHFESKQKIVAELLERSLQPSVERATMIAAQPSRATSRLCAYVLSDLRELDSDPLDARGIYMREVLDDGEFAAQRLQWETLRATVRTMVLAARVAGEIRPIPVEHVERFLWALILEAMASEPGILASSREGWVEASVEIMFCGVLTEPAEYPSIRHEAQALLDDVSAFVAGDA